MNAPKQSMSELLSQVSVIASVKSSSLGLSRTDKNASRESDANHAARQGSSRVNVSRLAGGDDRIKEINACAREAREIVQGYSSAWGDNTRLLPNANLQKCLGEFGVKKQEFDQLVEKLVADAPRLIEQARNNLGTYDIEPPSVAEIEDAFSLEVKLEPVPDSKNFKGTSLDSSIEGILRDRFEKNIEAAYQQATRDTMQRLADPLGNIVDRMKAYNEREADKAKGVDSRAGYFRDSVITNVQDIVKVFDSFNLTGDPLLQAISDKLSAFEGIEADDLRNNRDMRDDVAKRAADILGDLAAGGWL